MSFSKDSLATRVAGKESMAAMAPFTPTMIGGAADLSSSTNTVFPGGESAHYTERQAGRNLYFGVREHGMGAAVNGMAAHGGIVRPYGSTFLQFADYMRGSIRLSALMRLPVAWVFTHDSVGLGEDGPTHQPVEHLAALRAIPELAVIRPADADETAEAWRVIVEQVDGPAALALSRQGIPSLGRGAGGVADASGLARGAYVLRDADDARATVVGTGTEVTVAVAAADLLAGRRDPGARRLDAVLGALRRAGHGVPGGDDPGGARVGLGRGRDHDGLGALGRQRGRDRPLRRVGAGPARAREARHHRRSGG